MTKNKHEVCDDTIREAFNFLINEFGFSIAFQKQTNNGLTIEYVREQRRVNLYHDYREDSFTSIS
jgi:hypothetical protein